MTCLLQQTSHANDFVNAKGHAREKPLLTGYPAEGYWFCLTKNIWQIDYPSIAVRSALPSIQRLFHIADPDTKILVSLAAVCLSGPYKNCSQKCFFRCSIDSHLFKTLHCDWKPYPLGWHIAFRAKTNKEVNGRPPLKKAPLLPGGYPREFLVGYVVPPGSPNSHPISDQKCYFSTPPFPDLASKIHTRFQTWPLRNYVIIEQLMKEMKSFLRTFQFFDGVDNS